MSATPQPTVGPHGYRLKTWTEEDALAAILDGEKLDPRENFRLPYDVQEYLYTLEKEALLRFPESKSRDEIEWKFVREEAILGRHASYNAYPDGAPVDGFVRLLSQALGSSQVSPDTMGGWLPSKGFQVVGSHLARNLYGDAQPALVVQIKTQDWLLPSDILLAISDSRPPGKYRLISVRPYWLIYYSQRQSIEEVTIVDHNGNSLPEIQAIADSEWPAICESQFTLYEWKGSAYDGNFENITKHVEVVSGDYWNSECKDPWEFGQPDARGVEPLVVTLRTRNWGGDDCTEYQFKVRYEWDGMEYTWVSAGTIPPDKGQPHKCMVGWAHAAAKDALYDQAIPIVVSALADWPKELNGIWGPSSKDLFRFKLGTWYAFQGNYGRAVATLQDLIHRPANTDFGMIRRIANTFLAIYQGSRDGDKACDAIYNLLHGEFDKTPDNFDFASSGRTIPAWGFGEPDWLSRVPSLHEVCERGWRKDLPWTPQAPTATPEPSTPTPEPTPTPSPYLLQKQSIDLIEQTLFKNKDTRLAAPLIEQLLAKGVIETVPEGYGERTKPYLRYLLALAYDVSGDEHNAVSAYWNLLRDYPDSLYSLIAKRKLERIAP